ncbi:MAG: RHS repeat domain-containing protein, partial [Planctomycetota bacterium]
MQPRVGVSQHGPPVFQSIYDDAGQLVQSIDPLGRTTQYAYDGLGRQTVQILPEFTTEDGRLCSPVTLYAYDDAGQLVAVTDPLAMPTDGMVGHWK